MIMIHLSTPLPSPDRAKAQGHCDAALANRGQSGWDVPALSKSRQRLQSAIVRLLLDGRARGRVQPIPRGLPGNLSPLSRSGRYSIFVPAVD